jgi:hypothetical protein
MQYGNQLTSAYSQLKIHIVTVETENKEKIEELNKKIEEVKSSILHNNNIPEVESNIPIIPSDLNEEWETVKENASRKIPNIPSELNSNWETVKANANREIIVPTIPSDLNADWETVKANANKIPVIEDNIEEVKSSIFIIPSDLNEKWDVVATLPIDGTDVFINGDSLYTWADQQVENIADCVFEIIPEDLGS